MTASPSLGRARSPDSKHISRHVEEFGTSQKATQKCNMCKWISNRASWADKCSYIDGQGLKKTWLIEHPDIYMHWIKQGTRIIEGINIFSNTKSYVLICSPASVEVFGRLGLPHDGL